MIYNKNLVEQNREIPITHRDIPAKRQIRHQNIKSFSRRDKSGCVPNIMKSGHCGYSNQTQIQFSFIFNENCVPLCERKLRNRFSK